MLCAKYHVCQSLISKEQTKQNEHVIKKTSTVMHNRCTCFTTLWDNVIVYIVLSFIMGAVIIHAG